MPTKSPEPYLCNEKLTRYGGRYLIHIIPIMWESCLVCKGSANELSHNPCFFENRRCDENYSSAFSRCAIAVHSYIENVLSFVVRCVTHHISIGYLPSSILKAIESEKNNLAAITLQRAPKWSTLAYT